MEYHLEKVLKVSFKGSVRKNERGYRLTAKYNCF